MHCTTTTTTTPTRPRHWASVWCVLLSVGVLVNTAASAKEFHRWVDENGVVHISDSLPPGYEDLENELLNERGVVKKRVPRAPTEEERRQLERLAAEQAAALEQQEREQEYVSKLFKSYATVDELELVHRSRMDALYLRQSRNDHRVRELRDSLRELMTEAKEYNFPYSAESSLPPIPDDLLAQLMTTNESLNERNLDAEILRRKLIEQERRFEADLEIYRQFSRGDSIARGGASASDGRR
ncbi:MAG: DUF4124 domain-containing protein [Pseudomonadota bacterium]